VVSSLLQHYHDFSLAKEYAKCQELVHVLLDYPADALRAGGTAAQRRSWLQEATAAVEEHLRSLGQLAAAAAAVSSAAVEAPAVAVPQHATGALESDTSGP
jgi:hypothetical protein